MLKTSTLKSSDSGNFMLIKLFDIANFHKVC